MNTSNVDHLINNLSTISNCIYRYIVPILYITSNIGNLLSALIFSKKSWKKNVCVFYFQVLLIINLCYNNSTTLAVIFIYGYGKSVINSNVILCQIYFYIFFLFTILAPTTLILASVDRLLLSSQKVHTRLYSSKRLAYFLISINTVIWILFNIHVFI